MNPRLFSVAAIALFFHLAVFGQVLPLRVYQTEEGLASSQVNAILQDREGYLWMGCTGGVSRFNGLRFDTYRTSEGLPHESCMQLFLDGRGQVIAITITGMAVFDPVADRFHPYGPTGNITAIAEAAGRKTILIRGKGLFSETEPGRWRQLLLPRVTQPVSLSGHQDRLLIADREHGIWQWSGEGEPRLIASIPGIQHVHRTENELLAWTDRRVYTGPDAEHLALLYTFPENELIRSATLETETNTLWVGTNTGLFRVRNQEVEHYDETRGLPGIPVWTTCLDRDGMLWIGSNHGLAKLPATDLLVYTRLAGVPANSVICFYQDANPNRMLIGSSNGLFAITPDGKISRLPYRYFQQYPVWAIVRDGTGQYWVATEGGGVVQWQGDRLTVHNRQSGALPGNNVTDLALGPDGELYVSCKEGFAVYRNGDWTTFSVETGLPTAYVRCLLVTPEDGVLLGTLGSGVVRFDGASFERITPDQKQLEAVYDMVRLDNRLWLATNYGVAAFDNGTVRFFDQTNGLINNSTTALLPVENGIWVATDGGASLLDLTAERVVRVLTVDEGLPGNEFTTHNALVRDPSGDIWMGVFGGVVRVRKSAGRDPSRAPVRPGIHLKALQYTIGNRDVTLRTFGTGNIQIPANVRNLVLDCDLIWFRNPGSLRAYYRLEGLDDRWVPYLSVNKLQARYPRPPAGRYDFSVRVESYAAGTSAEEHALVRIQVLRPWWRHPLAWIIGLALVVMVTVRIIRYRVRKLELERPKLDRLVKEQTRRLEETNLVLARKNLELQQLAETDFLTTLYNRRYFMQTLRHHIQLAAGRTRRSRCPSCSWTWIISSVSTTTWGMPREMTS